MRISPRSLFVWLAISASGFGTFAFSQEKQPPKEKQTVVLRQPLKEARLEVHRVRLKKPAEVVEQGVKREVSVVLEFRVTSSQAIPVRALDPVLMVGEVPIREYRYEDHDRTLVFTLYDPEKAKDGAAIYLKFGNDAASRTELQSFRTSAVKEN
jgi:hypothetical protein